jgi:hypothetical protein
MVKMISMVMTTRMTMVLGFIEEKKKTVGMVR